MARPGLTVVLPLATILVIAAIAIVVPFAESGHREDHGEIPVVSTLRRIHGAQGTFAGLAVVDDDRDWEGEYGTFLELSGHGDIRGEPGRGRLRIDQRHLSPAFEPDQTGVVLRNGYYFRILLPGTDGQALCPDADPSRYASIHPPAASRGYLVHAWPSDDLEGPWRTFLMNQKGRLFATLHERRFGPEGPPPAAGLSPVGGGSILGPIADGVPDVVGNVWVEVR